MKILLSLSYEEILDDLPFGVICETRCSSRWNTGKRKRLWKQLFTPAEKKAAIKIFRDAHRWALTTGVPDEITMTKETYMLWHKLGMFCASI